MTRHLLGLFIMFAIFASGFARAEEKTGSAAQLKREVSLRKEPSQSAPSAGRLPKGTILTLQGQEKNGFVAVDVELEDGSVEGWIPRDALNQIPDQDDKKKKQKGGGDDDDGDDDEPVSIRRPRKVVIPKDEGLLLRRDPLFFYGLQAGGGISYLTDPNGATYTGPNYGGGAHVGIHLDRAITARLDVAYDQLSGSSGTASSGTATGTTTPTTTAGSGVTYQYAFVNFDASLGYWIEAFELSAGVRASYGISLTDLPVGKVDGASDLSNVGVVGGIGYKVNIGEVTDLVFRAKGSYSFLTTPLNFITGGLFVYLSFRG